MTDFENWWLVNGPHVPEGDLRLSAKRAFAAGVASRDAAVAGLVEAAGKVLAEHDAYRKSFNDAFGPPPVTADPLMESLREHLAAARTPSGGAT